MGFVTDIWKGITGQAQAETMAEGTAAASQATIEAAKISAESTEKATQILADAEKYSIDTIREMSDLAQKVSIDAYTNALELGKQDYLVASRAKSALEALTYGQPSEYVSDIIVKTKKAVDPVVQEIIAAPASDTTVSAESKELLGLMNRKLESLSKIADLQNKLSDPQVQSTRSEPGSAQRIHTAEFNRYTQQLKQANTTLNEINALDARAKAGDLAPGELAAYNAKWDKMDELAGLNMAQAGNFFTRGTPLAQEQIAAQQQVMTDLQAIQDDISAGKFDTYAEAEKAPALSPMGLTGMPESGLEPGVFPESAMIKSREIAPARGEATAAEESTSLSGLMPTVETVSGTVTPESLQAQLGKSPYFQYRQRKGEEAIKSMLSGGGGSLTGAKALAAFRDLSAQLTAEETEQQWGRISQLAGYGSNLTGSTANLGNTLSEILSSEGANVASITGSTAGGISGLTSAGGKTAAELALQRGNIAQSGAFAQAQTPNLFQDIGSIALSDLIADKWFGF